MYKIFDIALDCDIPLPELLETRQANTVINISAGTHIKSIPDEPNWFHHWEEPNGTTCISCAKHKKSYILRFPGLVDFLISKSGNTIKYFSEPEIPSETIRHLLLDQVVPRILGQQGRLILHASAVQIKEKMSIAFLGTSGLGKSTLASSFHQNGAKLITDDCLLLDVKDEKIIGIPNYFGVRLFEDSATAIFDDQLTTSQVAHYSTKSRYHLPEQHEQTKKTDYPLGALFILSDSKKNTSNANIIITPVQGATEIIEIIKQSFILDVTDMSIIKSHFQNMKNLVSSNVKIYRLQYPRNHDLLSSVRSEIENIL